MLHATTHRIASHRSTALSGHLGARHAVQRSRIRAQVRRVAGRRRVNRPHACAGAQRRGLPPSDSMGRLPQWLCSAARSGCCGLHSVPPHAKLSCCRACERPRESQEAVHRPITAPGSMHHAACTMLYGDALEAPRSSSTIHPPFLVHEITAQARALVDGDERFTLVRNRCRSSAGRVPTVY